FALVLLLPFAAVAQVVQSNPPGDDGSPQATITITCDAGGTATTTLTRGYTYEKVATGDLVECLAATCATGGNERPKGNHGLFYLEAGPISCRSDTGGKLVL